MTADLPTTDAVLAAVDATWPAAERAMLGGWVLRRGEGGGRRVSSVWPKAAPDRALDAAIAEAEARMRIWGQRPIFQLSPADVALDAALAERGWAVEAPCPLLAAPIPDIAAIGAGKRMVIRVRAPLAALDELWAEGGVGPARRAVMARAQTPKETLILREDDRAAAAVFIGVHDGTAIAHAVQVAPRFRRRGLGRAIMAAAALWAEEQGAGALALPVEEDNAPAQALYRGLGMVEIGRYHYRVAPEEAS
jgi:ribosomal protein S18 acetylase RimI-like enzyme